MKYVRKFSEQDDKLELRKAIMDLFIKNPHPQDIVIHKMAEDRGMDPSELETEIYAFFGDFLGAGKFVKSGKKIEDFDPKEMEMGEKVEYEHTKCKLIARRISADHLSERSDYYSFGKSFGIFDELK